MITERTSTSGWAIASLVCGILGFFTLGTAGLLAVIFGHIALWKIKHPVGESKGRGLAIAGLVTGYLTFGAVTASIFAVLGTAKNARYSQTQADFRSLEAGLMSYRHHSGVYPTTEQGLEALVEKPATKPVPRRWSMISTLVPRDPWKSIYRYRFPGAKNPEGFELISDGPDQTPGTADDIVHQGS